MCGRRATADRFGRAGLIAPYWDIGRAIAERQAREGWGAGVIPRPARDIRNELPEDKGFSERNIGYMVRFAREYGDCRISQQAAAKSRMPHGTAHPGPRLKPSKARKT